MAMSDLQLYPAEVFWSDEDDGFVAVAPDLPGCSAVGSDEATALAELRTAIAAWIEAAKKAGNTIPAPSRPADREQFSGKFLVRVPRRLHADLVRVAKSERVSLNHYVVYVLTEAVTSRASTTSAANVTWVSEALQGTVVCGASRATNIWKPHLASAYMTYVGDRMVSIPSADEDTPISFGRIYG